MTIMINRNKSIGKVLYIVEGNHTEPYLLSKIFNKIFDYQFERILREYPYKKFNSKINPTSRVFVINTESSNIKTIAKDNNFLDNLFTELIENYDFNIDNATIFYLFDRDCKSNTDKEFIRNMLGVLKNSRENEDYNKQGLLLISYPSIESFTLSNFRDDSFLHKVDTGDNLKDFLDNEKINQSKISLESLSFATKELINALKSINLYPFDIDNFCSTNVQIFDYEEDLYANENVYQALSLICLSLIDLGLIEIKD